LKKYYLDSNILVAISVGKEKEPDQFRLSSKILKEIRDGRIMGVVSSLVLMEVVTVLRLQAGWEQHNVEFLSDKEHLDFILDKSEMTYHSMMFELLQLPNVKLESGRHVELDRIMKSALAVLQKTWGRITHSRKSTRPGSKDAKVGRFKVLGSVDMVHAFLVKNTGCDGLITLDRSFEEIRGFGEFDNMEFRILTR